MKVTATRMYPRVTVDGTGVVSHAGTALLRELVSRCTVPVCLGRRHTTLWRAKSVASMPAGPDIRCRAMLVLGTQRHIIGAGEALPSSHGRRQSRMSISERPR